MADSIKLPNELIANAKRIGKIQNRSVSDQIEHYFKIALVAEQNPELPYNLIQELIKARSELPAWEYRFKSGI